MNDTYKKQVCVALPCLIFLVIDDSGSMADRLIGTNDPRFLYVERLIGSVLKQLLDRCTELRGDTVQIRPRYFLHVIVYGSDPRVWGDGLMDIQQVVERYTHSGKSFGLGGNEGGTDAAAAFEMAYEVLEKAVGDERFRSSFPPIVFHLTDGESATDATDAAEKIKQLSTEDGNVLGVNTYIGTKTNLNYAGPEDFPGYVDPSDVGTSDDNIRLFNMSSPAPQCIGQNLIEDGIFPQLRSGARLFFDVRTQEMLKHAIQVVGSQGSRADRSER